MPEKKVVSFFPRRKEGEEPDGHLMRRISIDYETLESRFHLPLKVAAREVGIQPPSMMGLCPTTFNRLSRLFAR